MHLYCAIEGSGCTVLAISHSTAALISSVSQCPSVLVQLLYVGETRVHYVRRWRTYTVNIGHCKRFGLHSRSCSIRVSRVAVPSEQRNKRYAATLVSLSSPHTRTAVVLIQRCTV